MYEEMKNVIQTSQVQQFSNTLRWNETKQQDSLKCNLVKLPCNNYKLCKALNILNSALSFLRPMIFDGVAPHYITIINPIINKKKTKQSNAGPFLLRFIFLQTPLLTLPLLWPAWSSTSLSRWSQCLSRVSPQTRMSKMQAWLKHSAGNLAHLVVQNEWLFQCVILKLFVMYTLFTPRLTFCLSRMIDWLSWPLAQHVDTWVIALLKGLAAVQKFTILIDVTLLKIELVCSKDLL